MANVRRQLGEEGERAAERFLRSQGYTIVERNYRCRVGEIDLIALERKVIVFVEVKTRRHDGTGAPLEAVTEHKQRKICGAAQYYLSAHRLHDRDARFDVVGVWWEDGMPRCELLRNAFEATDR